MGRYSTKRTAFIVVFVPILLFGLVFLVGNYLASPAESKNITISYSSQTADVVTTIYGDNIQSDSGKDFLILDMTIDNNGYESFSTNQYWFHVIVEDIEYDFDYHSVLLEDWMTVDVLDGETFQGILMFQIPESASSFTLVYESAFSEYKIVWNEI
ncbi:MAG: DUF4352 domain-containing protein [Candidatus Bathyarchaeum sp.]|nr:MAG: DUF4352 domain-containing protein [Candidatus Bathyarchaeum sp.]